MQIHAPEKALFILQTLAAGGHAAYLVGGCVRDSLLERTPGDWDIATGATPQEVIRLFAEYPVLETGLQHGTVTVLLDHAPFEVTTFRVDGVYSDSRRPDAVTFVRELREDLARRDFTINALAWNPQEGLVDYFDGQGDLVRRRIACVGEPAVRFGEDALRILRAVRFASTLGFSIEEETARAMERLAPTLRHIAVERIRVELDKAVCGVGAAEVLRQSRAVLEQVLPARVLAADRWDRALDALAATPEDRITRLAAVLFRLKGVSELLRELRYESDAIRRVGALTAAEIAPEAASVKWSLHRLGIEDTRRLLAVKSAWGEFAEEERAGAEAMLDAILREGACYSLAGLAVGGHELLELGLRGEAIGRALAELLRRVIEEDLPNRREELLAAARGLL